MTASQQWELKLKYTLGPRNSKLQLLPRISRQQWEPSLEMQREIVPVLSTSASQGAQRCSHTLASLLSPIFWQGWVQGNCRFMSALPPLCPPCCIPAGASQGFTLSVVIAPAPAAGCWEGSAIQSDTQHQASKQSMEVISFSQPDMCSILTIAILNLWNSLTALTESPQLLHP